MLRRILIPKRDEVTGGWRKLHNEGLHKLVRWAGRVPYMWKQKVEYIIFMWRPEGKRPLGRPRRKWEGNIKIWLEGVDWTHLAEDRYQWWVLVSMVMNVWIYKMLVISQVDEQLLTSHRGLSSMEFVSDLHFTTVTEERGPSKMSVNFSYQMTMHRSPEDNIVLSHCCEKPESLIRSKQHQHSTVSLVAFFKY
jgi:hypothetical protein